MKSNKLIFSLSILVVILALCSTAVGLFYSNGGQPRMVENIYGETVRLFGDGVYANNSVFKAATAKGTDIVMMVASLLFLVATFKREGNPKIKLLHGGLLVSILYYSITTAFGITYSRVFLLYLIWFSASFFATIACLIDLNSTIRPANKTSKFRATAIFTILSGCTVLVWLMNILPATFTGAPMDLIEIYTTEPTFIVDLGIILPTCVLGGYYLLKKKTMGYILPPIMLTFLSIMALIIVGQSAVQLKYGVVLSLREILGYVISFIVFGLAAVIVNLRFLKKCWPAK